MTQPQHEGKPLSEAELKAIRKRSTAWELSDGNEDYDLDDEAYDDRHSLLQHIAWLDSKLVDARCEASDSLNALDVAEAKLTSATVDAVLEAVSAEIASYQPLLRVGMLSMVLDADKLITAVRQRLAQPQVEVIRGE